MKDLRFGMRLSIMMCLSLIFGLIFESNPVQGAESLEEAWNNAILASQNLQAENDSIASAAQNRQAATAARQPDLKISGSYTVLSDRPTLVMDASPLVGSPVSVEVPLMNQNFGTSGLTVSMPLYVGGKIRALEEAGEALVAAAKAGKNVAVSDLKLQVMQTYFMVQRLEKLLQVAQAAEKSLAQHEKDVEVMLAQGVVTQTAQLSAQSAHARAIQTVVQVSAGLQTSRAAYNRLQWRPLNQPVSLQEIALPPSYENVEVLMEQALTRRQELVQIGSQADAVQAKSRSERAERLPHAAVCAGGVWVDDKVLEQDLYAQGTVGVTWTPFNQVSRAKESAAASQAASIRKRKTEIANDIRLQVQKAFNDEHAARQNIETAHYAVVQAHENLKMVNNQFAEGIATYSEVLDANALWTQAYSDYFNAFFDTLTAAYTLRYATGEI